MSNEYDVACKIFSELRQEVLASQKIRAQIIGVKITFVGTAIGLIIHQDKGASGILGLPNTLLVIPAFAAIFFDLLIISYGFSIKRIGYYCRAHLEKAIRSSCSLSSDFILWQRFLEHPNTRQNFGNYGNLGLTFLALVPAVIALFSPIQPWISLPLLAGLLVGFGFDMKACIATQIFRAENFPPDDWKEPPEPEAVTPSA